MKIYLITSLFIVLAFSSVRAGVLMHDFSIGEDEFSFEDIDGKKIISLKNGILPSDIGRPSLPSLKLIYSIPAASAVRKVETTDEVWEYLGSYRIFPSQGLVKFGVPFFIAPEDTQVYSTNGLIPESTVDRFSTGVKSGFSLCSFELNPFRYNPVTGDLYFLRNCRIQIHYDEGLGENVFLSDNQLRVFMKEILGMVENPGDVFMFKPYTRDLRDSANEYIIVAPQSLSSEFEELIEWKSRKGFSSSVVSAEWIYSNYTGYDNMEKIRNFVQDMHQNHGLIYLVLAGDYDNLGARIIPIKNYSTTETTPSDLYFSDVVPYSSNWDGNGNHIYGEYGIDGCDWFSDVYVGRFPLNSSVEVQRWVSKVLDYERAPASGYHERSLMAGAGLWPNINYYGDRVCNYITQNCLPAYWEHNKMYQLDTLSFPAGFADSFNQGYAWCQLCGHGNYDGVYWYEPGGAMLSGASASGTTNGVKLGVVHSIACEPGWFDNRECMGEKLFNSPGGGAIAVQFNARYGWGSPPSFGPSEWLCIWLAEAVFVDEVWNIGTAHGTSKDRMVPGITQGQHWCITELNLFADPETPIYSKEPCLLNISYDPVINQGPAQYSVSVAGTSGPVGGALCCLSDRDDLSIKFRALTDASGNAVINSNFVSSPTAVLSVTAQDHISFLDTLPVSASASYIAFTRIDSISGGYFNGQINPGCNYSVRIEVSNFGYNQAHGVKGIIFSTDPGIVFSQDTLIFGNIDPSDSVISSNSAGFTVQNNVPDSTEFNLTLQCFDQNDSTWTSSFQIFVNSPEIRFVSLKGPGSAFPGDTLLLTPVIENLGSADAVNPVVKLRCSNPYVTVIDSSENPQTISSGETVELYRQFSLSISENCPEPSYLDLVFELKTESLDVYFDTFSLFVGEAFNDDFEGTLTNWEFLGPASWHVTQHSYNSPVKSMYCGVENSWTYANSIVNSRIATQDLTISTGSELSFWHKYEIYDNKDKVQVQISTDGGTTWSLINPIQGYTGRWVYSPYDSIYTGSQPSWQEQNFILDYDGTVRVCWLFFSNPADNAEGYYFDDVSISLSSGLTSVEEQEPPIFERGLNLLRAYPNPTSGRVMISYILGTPSVVKISVYDITGREIAMIFEGEQTMGRYSLEWDGRDQRGVLVSSGTYFYRVCAGESSSGDKLVIVR